MKFHNIKITPKDEIGYYTITLDGQELNGVTNVRFEMDVNMIPEVMLTMLVESVEAEVLNCNVKVTKSD